MFKGGKDPNAVSFVVSRVTDLCVRQCLQVRKKKAATAEADDLLKDMLGDMLGDSKPKSAVKKVARYGTLHNCMLWALTPL